MKHMRRWLWVLAATALLTSCDSGPKGPGTLPGVVSGGDLGAVVLTVSGPGILGFEGGDGSKVYSAALSPNALVPTYRVIVVGQTGGDLHFGIKVEDVGWQLPKLAVLDAVDSKNAALAGADVHVKVTR